LAVLRSFFQVIDDDGSDSLTVDEFAEGLTELGFFAVPDIPDVLSTELKVLTNLYPLLDASGTGACSCEQLMFLEKDKDKRAKILRELARIREFGKDVGGAEPLKSNAQKMLHKIACKTTPLGGQHWSSVTEPMAVGEPLSPGSPGGRLSPQIRSQKSGTLARVGKQENNRLFKSGVQ